MTTPTLEEIQTLTASELLTYIKQWGDDRRLTDPAHSSSKVQGLKLVSEIGELCDNLAKGKDVRDDIGDCMVVLVMIAALEGKGITECLAVAYGDIKDRKGLMYEGVFVKESDPRYAELVEFGAEVKDPKPARSSSAYEMFMQAAEQAENCSLSDFHAMLAIEWAGGDAKRRAQVLAAECAMFLSKTAKSVDGTSQAVVDGYYTMYNKILSETATYEEVVGTAFYLMTQCFPLKLTKDTAEEAIKNGLK